MWKLDNVAETNSLGGRLFADTEENAIRYLISNSKMAVVCRRKSASLISGGFLAFNVF